MHVELLPEELAIDGLQAADVLQTVNAAYHGRVAAALNQAARSMPVAVRIAHAGGDPLRLGSLLLRGRDGALTPLSSVAGITMALSRSLVDHQDGLRRQIVVASPKGADQVGFAERARQAIAAKVPLPPGVFLRYGGAAEAQAAAKNELLLHSAAAFVLIVLLLALGFGQPRHVLLVLLSLPSTLIGGVAATALTGGTLTLGAMGRFFAPFGVAARHTLFLGCPFGNLGEGGGRARDFGPASAGA